MLSQTNQPDIFPSQKNSSTQSNQLLVKSLLKDLEKIYQVHFLYESAILAEVYIKPFKIRQQKSLAKNLQFALKKTNLKYVKVSSTTYAIIQNEEKGILFGTVREVNNQTLTGASVNVIGESKGTTVELNGTYRLELPIGQHKIEVSYVGFKSKSKTIDINANDPVQLDFKLVNQPNLDEVVVVGSRFIKNSLLENTQPAEIIQQEQLENSAQSETTQLLHYLVPSFYSTHQTISDGTDHIDPATLRGLSSDQLLVLINGKRRHHSALVNINGTVGRGSVATDLNAIPASAIKRIEVLRDGAATEYGSDAIAGVINIVLKDNANLKTLNLSSGVSQQGDGGVFNFNSNYGFDIGKRGGFVNFTIDFRLRGAVNRSGDYTGIIFGDERDDDEKKVNTFFEEKALDGKRIMSIGSSKSTNGSIFFNAKIPLTDQIYLYTFGGTSYRQGISNGFFRFPYQEERQAGIHPYGFLPILQTNIFDRSLCFGIYANNSPWKFDFSNTFGSNGIHYTVKNSNNASLGLASPTRAEVGNLFYYQNITNLDIGHETNWKIPFRFRLGGEFRVGNYKQERGDEISWIKGNDLTSQGVPKESGFQMFPGFRPENEVHETRYNLGVYGNIEADLSSKLKVNAATRYEYFSDFNSNFIYKFGTNYAISDVLSFRGTFNTSFRAPSMPQIYYNTLAFQFTDHGNGQSGSNIAHYNNKHPVTKLFGIEGLKPETSRNYSLGFASKLFQDLSLTVDAYNIYIKNRIILTGQISADDDPRFARILSNDNVNRAQFFTNVIDTKTRGLDFSFNYKLNFKETTLSFSLASNITKTKVVENEEGEPLIRTSDILKGFGNLLINREEISRIEVAQPNNKTIFSTHFKSKKLTAFLAFTNFGKVQFVQHHDDNPSEWILNTLTNRFESRDQTFSSKII
ncbi:MAG TPA: TonB-dependent receptor, partial [Candidatus Moranbacteria bacterium]|nr:TonB-dependent receptor [Candidatus Moranbacteria bacterium]